MPTCWIGSATTEERTTAVVLQSQFKSSPTRNLFFPRSWNQIESCNQKKLEQIFIKNIHRVTRIRKYLFNTDTDNFSLLMKAHEPHGR